MHKYPFTSCHTWKSGLCLKKVLIIQLKFPYHNYTTFNYGKIVIGLIMCASLLLLQRHRTPVLMTNAHYNDIILRLPASSNRLVMTQLRPLSGEREGGKKKVKRWSQPSRAHSPRVSLMQTHHCNVWRARTDLLSPPPKLIPKFNT